LHRFHSEKKGLLKSAAEAKVSAKAKKYAQNKVSPTPEPDERSSIDSTVGSCRLLAAIVQEKQLSPKAERFVHPNFFGECSTVAYAFEAMWLNTLNFIRTHNQERVF